MTYRKYVLATAAIAVLAFVGASAYAAQVVEETTTTTTKRVVQPETRVVKKVVTEETPIIATGSRVINLMEFDLNRDTMLSTVEVGDMLFRLYDTDGNEVIDNNEFERRAVLTVLPVEKQVVTTYDFNNDGLADETHITTSQFLADTRLTRFDKNKDGLSPAEFLGMSFLEADINRDGAVEQKEWRGQYIASLGKKLEEEAQYNK